MKSAQGPQPSSLLVRFCLSSSLKMQALFCTDYWSQAKAPMVVRSSGGTERAAQRDKVSCAGLIHYQQNLDCYTASYIITYNSADPGTQVQCNFHILTLALSAFTLWTLSRLLSLTGILL